MSCAGGYLLFIKCVQQKPANQTLPVGFQPTRKSRQKILSHLNPQNVAKEADRSRKSVSSTLFFMENRGRDVHDLVAVYFQTTFFQNSLTAFFHFSINALWKSESMNQICHLWHGNCRVKVIVLYFLVNKC